MKKPIVITGPIASGKTKLANIILELYEDHQRLVVDAKDAIKRLTGDIESLKNVKCIVIDEASSKMEITYIYNMYKTAFLHHGLDAQIIFNWQIPKEGEYLSQWSIPVNEYHVYAHLAPSTGDYR